MQVYNVGAPLERLAIDVIGPLPETDQGNRYILVVMDYFSKWVEVLAMPEQSAATVAHLLVNEVISRFGVPLQIHTDQGCNFESVLFKEVCMLVQYCRTDTTREWLDTTRTTRPVQVMKQWFTGRTGHGNILSNRQW